MADASGADGSNGAPSPDVPRTTLNTAVRRRRADRAFYLRLAGAIRQNERAIALLKR
jgi:hypothetical protein